MTKFIASCQKGYEKIYRERQILGLHTPKVEIVSKLDMKCPGSYCEGKIFMNPLKREEYNHFSKLYKLFEWFRENKNFEDEKILKEIHNQQRLGSYTLMLFTQYEKKLNRQISDFGLSVLAHEIEHAQFDYENPMHQTHTKKLEQMVNSRRKHLKYIIAQQSWKVISETEAHFFQYFRETDYNIKSIALIKKYVIEKVNGTYIYDSYQASFETYLNLWTDNLQQKNKLFKKKFEVWIKHLQKLTMLCKKHTKITGEKYKGLFQIKRTYS